MAYIKGFNGGVFVLYIFVIANCTEWVWRVETNVLTTKAKETSGDNYKWDWLFPFELTLFPYLDVNFMSAWMYRENYKMVQPGVHLIYLG